MNDEISIFELNGKFVSSFGTKGINPGEFESINSISFTESNIIVYDGNGADPDVFDLAGNYVTTIPDLPNIYSSSTNVVSNNTHIFVIEKSVSKIAIFNTSWELVDSLNESKTNDYPEKIALTGNTLYVSEKGTNVSLWDARTGEELLPEMNMTFSKAITIEEIYADENGFYIIDSESKLTRYNLFNETLSNLSANVKNGLVDLTWNNSFIPLGSNFLGYKIYRSDVNSTDLKYFDKTHNKHWTDKPNMVGNYTYCVSIEFLEGEIGISNTIVIHIDEIATNLGGTTSNQDKSSDPNSSISNINSEPSNQDKPLSSENDSNLILIISLSIISVATIGIGIYIYNKKNKRV